MRCDACEERVKYSLYSSEMNSTGKAWLSREQKKHNMEPHNATVYFCPKHHKRFVD